MLFSMENERTEIIQSIPKEYCKNVLLYIWTIMSFHLQSNLIKLVLSSIKQGKQGFPCSIYILNFVLLHYYEAELRCFTSYQFICLSLPGLSN